MAQSTHPGRRRTFTCCLYPWYSLCRILARQLILERPSSGFGFEQSSIEALLIDPAHTGQSDMNFAKKGEKRKNSKFKITAERILVMVCSDVQMN